MIEVFKSSRLSNRKYVATQFIWGLAIAAIWPLYNFFYLNSQVNDTYYYLMISVLVVSLIREAFLTRVSEIEFNIETQQIVFHSGTIFSHIRQRSLLFKYAKLEIDTKVGWRGESMIIYFLSSKMEVCKVNKGTDGFSNETLFRIRDLAKKLSLPISKY